MIARDRVQSNPMSRAVDVAACAAAAEAEREANLSLPLWALLLIRPHLLAAVRGSR